ncbi:MAG: OmpH family outer membrane protein [Candidatus Omnitrophica bacterium]|nr:OmpH family outer membrane protein [Candidatus Omnitrophota bacterium]
MNRAKVFGLTAVLGLALATAAFAKDLKIAYVDLSRLFDNYQKTKEYDAVLQKESEGFQKERDAMINKIRDAQGKLALLKEDEKQKVQGDIDKQKNDLIEYDKQKRTELAKKRDEKVREILLEIEKIVSEMAKKEGYDYVLNDRVLIYGDQSQNITDKVLKALNDGLGKK